MKLTILDRLLIASFLPKESNIITQILCKDIREKVQITQEETAEYEIKADEKGVHWNKDKVKEIEVEFTEAEISTLKSEVNKLDSEKKITPEILELAIKIKEANKVKEEK